MAKVHNTTRSEPKTVKMISYWPKGDYGHVHCLIRHTAQVDAPYVARCQQDDPSACVWIVPGTED